MARTMSERAFTDLVLELLRYNGWRTMHIRPARTEKGWRTAIQGDGAGWPDIFATRGKRALAIELKVGSNKPTQKQWAWLEALAEAGIETHVLWPRDLEDFKKAISRRAA